MFIRFILVYYILLINRIFCCKSDFDQWLDIRLQLFLKFLVNDISLGNFTTLICQRSKFCLNFIRSKLGKALLARASAVPYLETRRPSQLKKYILSLRLLLIVLSEAIVSQVRFVRFCAEGR